VKTKLNADKVIAKTELCDLEDRDVQEVSCYSPHTETLLFHCSVLLCSPTSQFFLVQIVQAFPGKKGLLL